MSSDSYRYYCLDSAGQLSGAEWFSAESDDEAVAHVGTLHPDGFCEVWKGKRLVSKLLPKRRQA